MVFGSHGLVHSRAKAFGCSVGWCSFQSGWIYWRPHPSGTWQCIHRIKDPVLRTQYQSITNLNHWHRKLQTSEKGCLLLGENRFIFGWFIVSQIQSDNLTFIRGLQYSYGEVKEVLQHRCNVWVIRGTEILQVSQIYHYCNSFIIQEPQCIFASAQKPKGPSFKIIWVAEIQMYCKGCETGNGLKSISY